MEDDPVEIHVVLSPTQAAALAVFVKRAGLSDFRELADSVDAAYDMIHAAARLRIALQRKGYDE